MKIQNKEYRTIWYEENVVKIIDQTKLPHQFIVKDLKTVKDAINAIKVMEVRGAPLIGGTAAYGMVLAVQENNDPDFIIKTKNGRPNRPETLLYKQNHIKHARIACKITQVFCALPHGLNGNDPLTFLLDVQQL